MYAQVGLKVEKAAIEISLSLNGFVIRGRRKESSREGKKKKCGAKRIIPIAYFHANARKRITAGFPRERNISRNTMKSTGAETRPSERTLGRNPGRYNFDGAVLYFARTAGNRTGAAA